MKKFKLYSVLVLVTILSACADFGDIDVSPNGAKAPLTSALITNILSDIGRTTAQVTPGLYCQYFAETQYTDASRYALQDVNWADYAGRLYDAQVVININTDPATRAVAALEGSNENQIAIARILKAYYMSYITDRYGDVPYSEALKGNSQPKYDAQEDIYIDLFKELDEAVKQFDGGALVKGDILFGTGTATEQVMRWKKFANSWRLILALRVSNADATLGAAQAVAALASSEGVFSSNADNVNITYPANTPAFSNPWFGLGADQAVSLTIANLLNNKVDDRRFAFGNVATGSTTLVGMAYGLQRQASLDYVAANPNMSQVILANAYRAANGTIQLLTYDQVALARAEAIELGWLPGGAAAAEAQYENGIDASWARWNQPTTNLAAYKNRADVDLTSGSGSRLDKIRYERWVSFYPNGQQGWSEWRRTNVPTLTPSPDAVNVSRQIPRRYIFPSYEAGVNGANFNAAVSLLEDGNTPESRFWWDNN
jgi:Starch-binding associating with outer membrane